MNRFYFSFCIALLLCFSTVEAKIITAKVVAIDQVYSYNRFGAYNPYGMMYALRRDVVDTLGKPIGANASPCGVSLRSTKRPRPLVLRGNVGDELRVTFTNLLCGSAPGVGGDRPITRLASMVANATRTLGASTNPPSAVESGIAGIAPGQTVTYRWRLEREGTYLIYDNAAPAGGEGDGGSLVLGLFGALNVEPANSIWYRSQVTENELKTATKKDLQGNPMSFPSGHPVLNYGAIDSRGQPVLNILNANNEIVHSDLNALVTNVNELDDGLAVTTEGDFREFTAIMHDELKTVQAFAPLQNEQRLHGIRDGFAFNYGSQSAGAVAFANRLGQGPAKDCAECALEEFFLTSWANGDPAMVVGNNPTTGEKRALYPDDPSNVHHSYLNDRVIFRNLHAGPKETHIFHLHAHQWLTQNDNQNSTYLDSETIGPHQGFNYEIAYGGSGNRNKTVGDSIFHCHLYPHFAQGMWELWRVHDVFENGTRRLPDGELGQGTNPLTGETKGGSPIPAVVPLPRLYAMAPMPSYGGDTNGDGVAEGMPGYPFYIAGLAGHRPPQAPLDMVADGGLPRHVIKSGTRTTQDILATNDLTTHLTSADIEVLPQEGTPLEKAAMNFHAKADGYPSWTQNGLNDRRFAVNGAPPAPGAPFADPCVGAGSSTGTREYRVSAVRFDLKVNQHGWHDPQAQKNVLDADLGAFESLPEPKKTEPFYFRAESGECVVFHHTNRTSAALELDDFQMRTPTDTIGQHIHLVKFDVTASDGSANGWNYEDGTFTRETLTERLAAGGGTAVDYQGNPVSLPLAATDYQTTVQRWLGDTLVNRLGQDRTLQTVYTHDHFSPSSIQQHGHYGALLIEPKGSLWLTPEGAPLANGNGEAVGAQAIIQGATDKFTHPDTREFVMAIADFAPVYDGNGHPVHAPDAPEAISVDDPGTFLVNYAHEPLPLRLSQTGGMPLHSGDQAPRADMANVLSSKVHGDPFTPIFKAYEGDRTRFRIIQGAQEEQHSINIPGLNWRRDGFNRASPLISAQEVGISEHFEISNRALRSVGGIGNTADYLYHFGSTDDLWNGAWGLLRTYDKRLAVDPGTNQPITLALLPNNPIPRSGLRSGCPTTAPIRNYSIEAWVVKDLLRGESMVYNDREGISDPVGLVFVEAADVPAYQANQKPVEPLVLRANAGDCIKLTLTNKLPEIVPDEFGDAPVPPITTLDIDELKPSNKVSLEPQLLSYDVRMEGGANVGFNKARMAAPGETVTYTWYAGRTTREETIGLPVEFGAVNLRPYGDVIKHGAQGLVAALIIEPQGASYWDAATGTAPLTSGTQATIQRANGTRFKEFVVVYQDGLNLYQGGAPIPDTLIADDPEDAGEKALNYRTEPFWARLDTSPLANLNASLFPASFMLGAIETPVFTAKAGEEVKFRVLHPDGRARQRGFSVGGHNYLDDGMRNFGAQGNSSLTVGKGITATLLGGAKKGTWIYRDGPTFMMSGGVWGQFVVE